MYDTIYFKSGETKPPGHKRDLIQCFEKSGCETSIGTRRQAPQGQSRARCREHRSTLCGAQRGPEGTPSPLPPSRRSSFRMENQAFG